jgi:hypothetical protein
VTSKTSESDPCEDVSFTNTLKLGCLTVSKTVDWSGADPDTTKTFTITVTGPGGYNQVITFDYLGNPTPSMPLTDLIPGTYTATETDPGPEWTVSPGLSQTIVVTSKTSESDPCEDVSFTNTFTRPPTCSTACAAQGPEEPGEHLFPDSSSWFTYIIYNKGDGTEVTPEAYPIFTNQTQLCGTLYVWNDGDTLHVKYTMAENGWTGFSAYHLQVDDTAEALIAAVTNESGNAIPGQCEYKDNVDMVDEIEVEAEISGYSDDIFIFAHSLICQ